jgi:hypothetical protein
LLALLPLLRKSREADAVRSDWIWGLAILALLLAARWPELFVTREFSPDESHLLAGAITLRHDPVFWRSVDGATAGPIDFYALLPVGTLTGRDDYFSGRLTALLLIAGTLLFAHQSVALVFGRSVARLGSLGTLCFEALTLHSDLTYYSTELAPAFLLAGAFYFGLRQMLSSAPALRGQAGVGFLLGAVPFAKLQAAPLALLLGGGMVAASLLASGRPERERRRSLIALVGGAATPSLAVGLMLALTGEWKNAVIPYFHANVAYVEKAGPDIMTNALELFSRSGRQGGLGPAWIFGGLGLFLVALLSRKRDSAPVRWLMPVVLVFLAATITCILIPRRPFVHYLQLLPVPWILASGVAAAAIWQAWQQNRNAAWRIVLLLGLLGGPAGVIYSRSRINHPEVGHLAENQATPMGKVAQVLQHYAQPGESLAVWGWMCSYYVESGLRQATREGPSVAELTPGPYLDFYRQRYLADFQRSLPPVFVDAVGGNNFAFHDRELAHDRSFPEFGALIRMLYTQVDDIAGSRIYVRNDRLALIRREAGPAKTR